MTDLEITDEYVHVGSAYPTSSYDGGYFRHYDCPYFVNRCPHCGGRLGFEQADPANGVIPGFTSIEGMYYCLWCDMDFSCISGAEHGNTGYFLTPYIPRKNVKDDKKVVKKESKKMEYHELVIHYFKNYKNIKHDLLNGGSL